MEEAEYDISFIGAGLSTTVVLREIMSLIEETHLGRKIRIAVIEKNSEFWTGVP